MLKDIMLLEDEILVVDTGTDFNSLYYPHPDIKIKFKIDEIYGLSIFVKLGGKLISNISGIKAIKKIDRNLNHDYIVIAGE